MKINYGLFGEGIKEPSKLIINIFLLIYTICVYIWNNDSTIHIVNNVMCVFLVVFELFYIINLKKAVIPLEFKLLLSFNLICCASYFWADNSEVAFQMAYFTLPLLTLFSFITFNYLYLTNQEFYMLKLLYYSGVLLAVYIIFTEPGGYFNAIISGSRTGGTVDNINRNAILLVTTFFLNVFLYLSNKNKVYLITMPLILMTIISSISITAIAMMIAGIGLIYLLKNCRSMISLFVHLLYISVALVLLISIMQFDIFETLNTRLDGFFAVFTGRGQVDNSALVRTLMWKSGFSQFLETPLLGIGINNGQEVALRSVGYRFYLHNEYLEILVGTGLLGASFYFGILFCLLRKLYINFENGDNLAATMIAIIVARLISYMGNVSYYDKSYYQFLLACIIFTYISNKKRIIYNLKK